MNYVRKSLVIDFDLLLHTCCCRCPRIGSAVAVLSREEKRRVDFERLTNGTTRASQGAGA